MDGISRRKLLRNTGAVGAGGAVGGSSLFSGCVGDVVGEGGLKIGVLLPYSGSQQWGSVSTWSFLSGLARVYGEGPIEFQPDYWASETLTYEPEDGDRTYEFLFRDTVFDPSSARGAAENLVLDENVDVLFGPISTRGVITVIENVVRPTDTLHMSGGTSSPDITADPDLCGRNVFRTNEHYGMEASAMSKYIAEETSFDEMYILGEENSLGQEGIREYRKALEQQGIDVAGERSVPPGFGSFRSLLTEIDSEAEALVAAIGVRSMNNFLSTFAEGNASGTFDIRGYGALPGEFGLSLMSGALDSALDEVTAESIRDEANLDALASRYHWNQYENSINDEFVSGFEETYGTLPALFAGGAYAAGYAVGQAVEKTGSQDPDDIAEAMYGMTVEETPKGETAYVFQEHNNQAKSDMTIANLIPNDEENWSPGLMPSEPIMTVDADEVAMSIDDPDMNCDLREG